jgi:hypothetical protein
MEWHHDGGVYGSKINGASKLDLDEEDGCNVAGVATGGFIHALASLWAAIPLNCVGVVLLAATLSYPGPASRS